MTTEKPQKEPFIIDWDTGVTCLTYHPERESWMVRLCPDFKTIYVNGIPYDDDCRACTYLSHTIEEDESKHILNCKKGHQLQINAIWYVLDKEHYDDLKIGYNYIKHRKDVWGKRWK